MPLRPTVLNFCLLSASIISSTNMLALALPDNVDNKTTMNETSSVVSPRLLLKPGQPLVVGMQAEDIVATYDVVLAREQVVAYPNSPEASFVLAVALTRTSMMEEALHEVRRARRLAEAKGGATYFDHMISEYEDMLKSYPNDNRVRYGLAWAYYMKAYVLTHYAKPCVAAKPIAPAGDTSKNSQVSNVVSAVDGTAKNANWHASWVQTLAQPANEKQGGISDSKDDIAKKDDISKLASNYKSINFRSDLPPQMVSQVKHYYEAALSNLDDLLAREPNDMWARAYRAFLYADYTGDLSQSMDAWKSCISQAPNNPAAYFFLGESYLQKGNLKECLQNISKAVALRGLPN